MDFGLSEDQVLLEETVRAFLADQVPITRVRELRDADHPYDAGVWKALAELGIAGVLVPEAHGGAGLGLLDAALVAQSLGHAATPTPFLASAVLAPVALRELGGAQAEAWLGEIAGGETVFGVAATECFAVREGAGVSIDGGTLSGKALMALDAFTRGSRGGGAWGPSTLAVVEGRRAAALELHEAGHGGRDALHRRAGVRASVAPEAVFENARGAADRRACSTQGASRSPPTCSAPASR